MKTIYNITIIIGCIFTFFACSSTPKNDSNMFNFGTYTYDEPFVGLLKSRPKVLVKSLDYPPFSWCKPDTVRGTKNFNIAFNEECVRSHSIANIQFCDESHVPTTGIMIYHAEKLINPEGITISADTVPQKLSLKFTISPQIGDTTFVGTMFINGKELDEVNDTALQQENQAIGHWTFTQKLGYPILLWLLWLITLLLIIAIFIFVLWLLRVVLLNIVTIIKSFRKKIRLKKSTRKKQEYNDLWELLYKYYPEMKNLITALKEQSPEYFKRKHFVLKRLGKKTFKIQHIYDGQYTKIELEICNNEIKAATGALSGEGRYDAQLNSFLNYPLPNKIYILDNGCFIYKTDRLGRVIKVNADIDKARILQRREKGERWNEYPKWVKEMDGTPNDDGGHLIACSLNGPAEKINIVPMNRQWQRSGGEWYAFENMLRKNAAEGKPVKPEIELLYKGNNRRPYAINARTNSNMRFRKMNNPIS